MKKILVMGMGAIGHTIVTSLDDSKVQIDIATSEFVHVDRIENNLGDSSKVSNVVTYQQLEENCDYDIIFLTLPYRHKISRMKQLEKSISRDTTIVLLPANQGALNYLPKSIQAHNPIILSERVPQISRIDEKYKRVNVYGTRRDLMMVGKNGADPLILSEIIPYMDSLQILNNEFEISLISSNAVLHTSRVYNLYANKTENYGKEFGFYTEWTEEDGKLLIEMEDEVIELKHKIEAEHGIDIYLYDLFQHFDINPKTPEVAKERIANYEALSKIRFFAADEADLMCNRYVVDDAVLGIHYYLELAKKYGVKMPKLQMIYDWAVDFVKPYVSEVEDLNV